MTRLLILSSILLIGTFPAYAAGGVCTFRPDGPSVISDQQNAAAWHDWRPAVEHSLMEKVCLASKDFTGKSKSLQNTIVFFVLQDGKIGHCRVLHASDSAVFDSLCIQALESIKSFPTANHPKVVAKGPLMIGLQFYYNGCFHLGRHELVPWTSPIFEAIFDGNPKAKSRETLDNTMDQVGESLRSIPNRRRQPVPELRPERKGSQSRCGPDPINVQAYAEISPWLKALNQKIKSVDSFRPVQTFLLGSLDDGGKLFCRLTLDESGQKIQTLKAYQYNSKGEILGRPDVNYFETPSSITAPISNFLNTLTPFESQPNPLLVIDGLQIEFIRKGEVVEILSNVGPPHQHDRIRKLEEFFSQRPSP